MRPPFLFVFALALVTILPKGLQAEPPNLQPEHQFLFHISIFEIEADGTQSTASKLTMRSSEGALGSCFVGQKIAVVAGGKVTFVDKGISMKVQATGAAKKRIHVGGTFEVLDPHLDAANRVVDILGSQGISEVVHPGETVKANLDLSKENGKEYRVELKVEEVKEDTKPGS